MNDPGSNTARLQRAAAKQLPDDDENSVQRQLLRRHHERHLTRVVALAHCHGRFQTVRVVDFSLGGLQLQGSFGVIAGDAITVELLSGHRLAAIVAWSIGDRLGVRFLEPLETGHPAIAVMQQRGRRTLERADREAADLQAASRDC